MNKSEKYTLGRYGGKEYAEKAAEKKGMTYSEYCAWFYVTRTGEGESRNPFLLSGEELKHYTPPLQRKKNQSIVDYRLKQTDYWFEHTKMTINGLRWYNPK